MIDKVYVLFAVRNAYYPNFIPMGAFTTREKALETIKKLPLNKNHYQLFTFPVNTFFGKFNSDLQPISELGLMDHEHFCDEENY
jgi:hypothetical protein